MRIVSVFYSSKLRALQSSLLFRGGAGICTKYKIKIIRDMEMFGNIRCVTYGELVGSGILSEPTYKKYVRCGKIRIVQRGGNGRKALIDYDSLY